MQGNNGMQPQQRYGTTYRKMERIVFPFEKGFVICCSEENTEATTNWMWDRKKLVEEVREAYIQVFTDVMCTFERHLTLGNGAQNGLAASEHHFEM